ncbi:hypothetical protein LX36DRAFT_174768 [Colletotrichum falcatum]|nr:hypothetical protein LX36DRAFT_174768 [Colletotrichum falcatum]
MRGLSPCRSLFRQGCFDTIQDSHFLFTKPIDVLLLAIGRCCWLVIFLFLLYPPPPYRTLV